MQNKEKDTRPFAQKYPKLNFLLGLFLLLLMMGFAIFVVDTFVKFVGEGISNLVSLVSKLDAVVIVALITGTVSIIGVIISSIVAKIIDYRKSRRAYLAEKREKPYGEFVEMIYKMREDSKKPGNYTTQQMEEDICKFSKELTLWGSYSVVKKWVKFRENGNNPSEAKNNIFLLEEIMNEMRKDLGLKKAKKGELLAFFVNDIKQVMNKDKQ